MNNEEPLAHSAKPDKGISAQTYAEHIVAVSKRANDNLSAMVRYLSGDAHVLHQSVKRAALLHDLGKLDAANQAVLKKGSKKHLPLNHVDAGTSYLSRGKEFEAAFFVYAHHIGLRSVPYETGREKLFLRDEKISREVDRKLTTYLSAHAEWCGKVEESSGEIVNSGWTELTRRLAFSCLVDADYGDTAVHYGGETERQSANQRWKERLEKLNEYVASLKNKSDASKERKEQRQVTYETCHDSDTQPSLYACDSPVGTGKTTAVMAHLLRAAIDKKLRHIFVVLPYTNIIKQSVDVYRKALVLPGENPEEVVAEHHHQADFSSYDLRQHASLWTAPIIVTTAVQFFETLGANHPAQLRKLHELPGSAIFLDEAHAAIPTWLWPQAWRWLKDLSTNWRCHFVFASGSLPRFWQNEKITSPYEDMPNLLGVEQISRVNKQEKKRVVYATIRDVFDVMGLINFIQSKSGPRLVVLNTVQSAAVLAWKMQTAGKQVIHLSTALTPIDRDAIVEDVKKRLQKLDDTDWTLVATSCVEAGMDFSFATAFRESCSAASLIQIGGRVNRHGNSAQAEVFDFRVNDPLVKNNPQLVTSRNVLKILFEEKYFEIKDPTEIVTEAMRRELMSDFGDFEKKSREIIKHEKTNDYPEVAKLCKVIDADTRLVVISPEIAEALRRYEKVDPVELIRNSVQIRFFKINTKQFNRFCTPVNEQREIYAWQGKYGGKFLGYMEAIVPLLEMDADGFSMV
ncbi:MAG: DEAD/DEAH box helicase family protein [Deltaproteobacteria bacterium]|nr:DEAD/DEAH box helicase family protein [Deltaproteobacteria bacterium]